MNSGNHEMVTLGADVGGKDAHIATHSHVLFFRRLLQQKCIGPYGGIVKEFALVLRIDGSVQAWGKRGIENATFRQKNSVVTVDIYVPINEWLGRDAIHIRNVIAAGVTDAIETVAKLAERKKIDISINSLRRDVNAAEKDFLA